MMPSGPPLPTGSFPSISPALLQLNSAILGSQGGSMTMQAPFSSFVSPQGQCNMDMPGNSPNVSSLLNQAFGNGGPNVSISGLDGFQQGSVDTVVESNPVGTSSNDTGFTSSFAPSNMMSSSFSGQVQGQQISNPSGRLAFLDQQQSQIQQIDLQRFQHGQHSMQQFSVSHSQPQQQQQQFPSIRGGLGAMAPAPVKLEQQMMNDQVGMQQKLQSLQSLGPVKQELQKQIFKNMGPVKLENQHLDQAVFLQKQQQQFLHMSRMSSQAAANAAQMNYLQQQQRILQLQQQQQLLRALPEQQPQQHFQQQNLPVRSAARLLYEPGTCARRLTQYIYQQQHRPDDNNIGFWRKFVSEFFTPNGKKRWCVSSYGSSRHSNGVSPQDSWHCEICNHKPARGFETTADGLPRLFKIKYDSGTLEELLYVDMPHEYHNSNGQIVLDYAKVVEECVLERLRVVRDGKLRIVFSPDLKIYSWEFCAQRHEELIPRRLIIPQVSQLGAAAQKYQASVQNASSTSSSPNLESNCNMFLASACQLGKALEVPLVNDLGYTKRFVRCLQISEVVNCMKDLMDYGCQTGKGPIESLLQFSRRINPLSGPCSPAQQPEKQQITGHPLNNDDHPAKANVMHLSPSANNSHCTTSATTSVTTIGGLLCQNSTISRVENQMNNPSSPYTGTPVQIPSAGSSTNLAPTQANPSSPFSSSTPSSSNNPPQNPFIRLSASTNADHIGLPNSPVQIPMQQSSQSNEVDPNDSQNSVEKILEELMIPSQFSEVGGLLSVGPEGDDAKNISELPQVSQNLLTSGNTLTGPGMVDNNSNNTSGGGLGNWGSGNDLSSSAGRMRATTVNNSGTLTGRVSLPAMHQDQCELANQLLNGVGAVNDFFCHQFDWKSP